MLDCKNTLSCNAIWGEASWQFSTTYTIQQVREMGFTLFHEKILLFGYIALVISEQSYICVNILGVKISTLFESGYVTFRLANHKLLVKTLNWLVFKGLKGYLVINSSRWISSFRYQDLYAFSSTNNTFISKNSLKLAYSET